MTKQQIQFGISNINNNMMSKNNNVLNLYQLIDLYLAKRINETEFCDKFFEVYDMTIDVNDLNNIEKKVFDTLNKLVGIFLEYEEKHPHVMNHYLTQKLKQGIEDAKFSLKEQDIYKDNDKRRLYWLIEQYMNGNIDETFFCDKFYYSYDLGINHDDLNEVERKVFYELDEAVDRFSPYKEDKLLDSKAFFTEEELRQKIVETYRSLKTQDYFLQKNK